MPSNKGLEVKVVIMAQNNILKMMTAFKGEDEGLLEMNSIKGAKIGWKDTGGEKGRGVYARADFNEGEIIEVAPVITVAASAIPEEGGAPDGYLLDWDPDEEGQEHCMPLGYIMLYNHSKTPNIRLESDYEEMTITVFAMSDIKAGEELCWNYSCEIWFDEG